MAGGDRQEGEEEETHEEERRLMRRARDLARLRRLRPSEVGGGRSAVRMAASGWRRVGRGRVSCCEQKASRPCATAASRRAVSGRESCRSQRGSGCADGSSGGQWGEVGAADGRPTSAADAREPRRVNNAAQRGSEGSGGSRRGRERVQQGSAAPGERVSGAHQR